MPQPSLLSDLTGDAVLVVTGAGNPSFKTKGTPPSFETGVAHQPLVEVLLDATRTDHVRPCERTLASQRGLQGSMDLDCAGRQEGRAGQFAPTSACWAGRQIASNSMLRSHVRVSYTPYHRTTTTRRVHSKRFLRGRRQGMRCASAVCLNASCCGKGLGSAPGCREPRKPRRRVREAPHLG